MARSPLFQTFVRMLHNAQTTSLATSTSAPLLSRRRFLKYSALASGAAIATTAISNVPKLSSAWASSCTIAIVGGGIAGLNAAYQLKKQGLSATVYEAKPFVGGRIQSRSVVHPALVNDLGGSFVNTDHEDILALVDELGLELFDRLAHAEAVSIPETSFYFDGRVLSELELVESLQPLADQILADATLLDEDFDTYALQFDELSVADYLDQHQDKLVRPYVRLLAETAIRTEYGAEPHESSALQLLYTVSLLDGERVVPIHSDEAYYVKGGSGQLIDALVQKLPGQIKTDKSLARLESWNRGFRLTFGDRSTVEADYVILAAPFTALRHVDLEVQLPGTLRRFIREVNLGTNEKVFAGFSDRPWHQEQGFVGSAWTDLGYAAVWEETQRQPEHSQGSLTFFLGGREIDQTHGNIDALGSQFVRRLDTLLPGVNAASTGQFYSTHWATDPYIGGGYTNFKPGQYTQFGEFMYIESDDPEEQVNVHVGNLVFAGEHLSDEFYGYMNGAAQTGRLAARVVAALVQSES